tara:strand:+ start:6775 stop:7071 length:297 start_codon:yes stop_codon:yes gene_type:complete
MTNFQRYFRDNPKVWYLFNKYANQVREKGFERYGVATVWERMRWYSDIDVSGDLFKLNNNYKAYYARLYMKHYHLDKFFELRTSLADDYDFTDELAQL